MSGKVHWVSIYDLHNYHGPNTIQKDINLLKESKSSGDSERWDKACRATELFYGNPEEWWNHRRRGKKWENITPGGLNDKSRSIEIPLKDVEDQELCDRMIDWLHDDNLQNDVYISHYSKSVEVEVETVKRWSIGGKFFSNKEDSDKIETIDVPTIGIVFENSEDTVQFKLACL